MRLKCKWCGGWMIFYHPFEQGEMKMICRSCLKEVFEPQPIKIPPTRAWLLWRHWRKHRRQHKTKKEKDNDDTCHNHSVDGDDGDH